MRRNLISDSKRIMALILSAAMILPSNYVVKADVDIIIMEDNQDALIQENDTYVSDYEDSEQTEYRLTVEDEADTSLTVDKDESDTDTSKKESELSLSLNDDETNSPISNNKASSDTEESISDDEGMLDEVMLGTSSTLTGDDKRARNSDALDTKCTKLRTYLAKKYSDLDTDKNGLLSDEEMGANTKYNEIVITSDYPEISKNMVNLKALGHFSGVQTIVIDGVDELRNFFLPPELKNITIRNTTLNLYSDGILSGYDEDAARGMQYFDFKTFILENVTIGNRFETLKIDDADESSDFYAYYNAQNTFKIYNCQSLEVFKVDVTFESDNSVLIFDAGSKYTFNKLTPNNVVFRKNGSIGKLQVTSSNENSYFVTEGLVDAVGVEFEDAYFKRFLLERINADTNGDSILTQAELNKITNLNINTNILTSSDIDLMHNFNDLAKLKNLENLSIDLDWKPSAYLNSIQFPDTGKLKSVRITNTPTKYDSIVVPSLEEFTYSNTSGVWKHDYVYYDCSSIVINDTLGRLSSLTMDKSNPQQIVVNNSSGNKGNLKLNVYDCNNLGSIEFQGAGYTLLGDVRIEECVNLHGFGSKTTGSDGCIEWQVDGSFGDSNQATLTLSNCNNLADKEDGNVKITVNYNFSNSQKLYIKAYNLKKLDNTHEFIINRAGNNPGPVKIYCGEADTWIKNKYTSATGFEISQGSSTPNIAVFPCGNNIRSTAVAGDTPAERWVNRYEIVQRLANEGTCDSDQLNNFSNTLSFYVEDEDGSIRELHYDGPIYLVADDPSMIDIGANNHTLTTNKQGRTTIRAYLDNEHTQCIGWTNLLVRSVATNLELTSSDTKLGTGTVEDPITIAKNNGQISFSATTIYDGTYLPDYRDGVLWLFSKPKEDTYEQMLPSDTTAAGINIVPDSDIWNGNTNTKTFKFTDESNEIKKFKLNVVTQANKRGRGTSASLIEQVRYIEFVNNATVDIPKTSIVHGTDNDSALIKITDYGHAYFTIDDADYSNYLEVVKVDSTEVTEATGKTADWKLKFKDNLTDLDNANIQAKINNKNTFTLTTNTDSVTHEGKTFTLTSEWVAPEYDIEYDLAGGTLSQENPGKYTVITPTITLNNPTRAGYIFVGWTGSNGETPQKNVTIPINSMGGRSFKAEWQGIQYTNTLKYDANGGSNAPSDLPDTVTYPNTKSTVTISSSKPTPYDKTGYTVTFDGWYDAPTGGNKIETSTEIGNNENLGGRTKTIYAHWKETANKYTNTLKYDANGGTNAPKNQEETVTFPNTKSTISVSSSKPTPYEKTGYTITFDGWYDSATGGNKIGATTEVGNTSIAGNQSKTIYAHWKETANKYTNTLKYDANGGPKAPADNQDIVTYPNTKSTITVSSIDPSIYDNGSYRMKFTGWYTAPTEGDKVEGTTNVGTANIADNQSKTIYAHWEQVNPLVDTVSLSLVKGEIGINFYMKNMEYYINDNAYISLGATEYPIVKPASSSTYVYSYLTNAKNIADNIEIRVYTKDSSGNKVYIPIVNASASQDGSFNYKITDYLNAVKDRNDELGAFAKAMLTYGECSQYYLGYNAPASLPTVDSDIDYSGYTATIGSELPAGVTYVGSSLLLNSSTTVRHYFRIKDISGITFKLDDKTLNKTEDVHCTNDLYYVDVTGINAINLDVPHTLTISDSTTSFNIKYSALSYCQKASNRSDNEALRALANSIYWYNKTAKNYFKN